MRPFSKWPHWPAIGTTLPLPSMGLILHMNKKHWNTIILDQSIPDSEIERMIDHSYGLVVKKLKKVEREALELSFGKEILYRD